jgi:hypothetical protein
MQHALSTRYSYGMGKLINSFWRAAVYCLHPRVIALSVLPLIIMAGISLTLGYFFWQPALDFVRANLESYSLVNTLIGWLEGLGLSGLRLVLAPVVVLFLHMFLPMVLQEKAQTR